ncbi:MAG: 8-oxo-dGTP diphosphatase MutT [Limisphaerales bacterium]
MAADCVIEVAAGLVFREGRLLIAQRRDGDHLGGLWEFPGGKRDPGETYEACLHRELMEELGIEVEVGDLYREVEHAYPERTVRLRFFLCCWTRHEPAVLGCKAFEWVGREDLGAYAFPAADEHLLEALMGESGLWFSGSR